MRYETEYDEHDWPIVIVKLPTIPLSDEEFQAHLLRLTAYYSRGRSFGMVIDMTESPPMPASQRRLLGDYIDSNTEKFPQIECPTAVVVTSDIQRAVIQVLGWLTRTSHSSHPCMNVEAGIAWVRDSLRIRP